MHNLGLNERFFTLYQCFLYSLEISSVTAWFELLYESEAHGNCVALKQNSYSYGLTFALQIQRGAAPGVVWSVDVPLVHQWFRVAFSWACVYICQYCTPWTWWHPLSLKSAYTSCIFKYAFSCGNWQFALENANTPLKKKMVGGGVRTNPPNPPWLRAWLKDR